MPLDRRVYLAHTMRLQPARGLQVQEFFSGIREPGEQVVLIAGGNNAFEIRWAHAAQDGGECGETGASTMAWRKMDRMQIEGAALE